MANDINWDNRFGKPPENWSAGEFRMVVISTLNTLNAQSKLTSVSLEILSKTVSLLPCSKHDEIITELRDCIKIDGEKKESRKLESFRGMISLRNAIIGIALTAIFSVLVTLLTSFFFIGKP